MRKFDSVRVMVGDVPLFDADAGQANGYGAVKLSGSVELDAK
jgi:flagellar motor switch protein FliM